MAHGCLQTEEVTGDVIHWEQDEVQSLGSPVAWKAQQVPALLQHMPSGVVLKKTK
jgi:hypothetical protein